MLRPVRVTPPASALVSIEEIRAHVRVDFPDDDAQIASLVEAATAHLDGWAGVLGRCLVNQTWRIDIPCWPATGTIRLPFPDVSAVSSVKYRDEDDVEQTVSSSLYELLEDDRGSLVRFLDGFQSPALYDDRTDRISVTFSAGYGGAGDVPRPIRLAVMMLAAHWYEHREAAGVELKEAPIAVERLIAPYRRVGV